MERASSLGCVIGQGVRVVDKKHALPHSRLVLEEGWQGGFCGSTSWLAEGTAGGEPDVAASPGHGIVSCVLAWDAQPWGGRSAPRVRLLLHKPLGE